jgi:hypothetical protein
VRSRKREKKQDFVEHKRQHDLMPFKLLLPALLAIVAAVLLVLWAME